MTKVKLKITRQEVLTFVKEMEPFLIVFMAFLLYLRKEDMDIPAAFSKSRTFYNGLITRIELKNEPPGEDDMKLVHSPGYEE